MGAPKRKRRLGTMRSGLACREMADKANKVAREISEISEICDKTGGDMCNKIIVPGFPFDRSLDEMPARLRNWSITIRSQCV